ncbi:MAG: hypothetical protein CVV64_00525 [Candidatus Wallbacteria bacterium HGW-Wallbacteria-1]|jgi:probable selenate reductase FAD-binding subunit|uniref:FAD-binding PCMH-type domain-containing protein n=1 Tax=Candidatus Wallbacteria bacterium HGW-Wallbacteria-1 TaxID=2013854 RepID=A0A2N1PUD2_9BACT|nr:MAG: hypothetical protein CVV64_00525 [Candidatus Wallbacteria bacterium HGW-Wallbacteria-1]
MIQSFHSPSTPAEAVGLIRENPKARYLAGGTELNSMASPVQPDAVVSLNGLGLDKLTLSSEGIEIGAMVTLETLLKSAEKGEASELLAQACSNVGNRNIRNMATVGGNIAACKSCSDLIPPLLVLGARVETMTCDGNIVTIDLEDFLAGPRTDLILRIIVPAPAGSFHAGLCRYTRTANDLALVSVCAGLEMEGTRCIGATIALGGVAAKPLRVREIENAVIDRDMADNIDSICSLADQKIMESIIPITDHRGGADYKMTLARNLLREALIHAALKGGVSR